MLKKVIIISTATAAAGLGVFGLVKNSRKIKMRKNIKRISTAMYNVGTMLRTLSCQVATT